MPSACGGVVVAVVVVVVVVVGRGGTGRCDVGRSGPGRGGAGRRGAAWGGVGGLCVHVCVRGFVSMCVCGVGGASRADWEL